MMGTGGLCAMGWEGWQLRELWRAAGRETNWQNAAAPAVTAITTENVFVLFFTFSRKYGIFSYFFRLWGIPYDHREPPKSCSSHPSIGRRRRK